MGKKEYILSSQHVRSLSKKGSFESKAESKIKRASSSDLWIPKRFVPTLNRRIAKFGSLKNFLSIILSKNRSKFHSMFAFSKSEKTIYQSTNLNLIRFSFRPDSSDWAELRVVARYYGLSICNLFIMLLQIDEGQSLDDRSRSIFEENKDLRIKGKGGGISLIQSILPGRKFISFSFFSEGNVRRNSIFDS
ncbi:DUF1564 family protein [Leptospira sp. 201903071]|uniref:DUF1564 family protein n=1 Tax=Leptospira ainazelensis TaxID=2810034 RepID=UPI00196630BD|nr:DUF1564 family protein [Leptospira ainazelensis]MBM9500483.1 DUF1564 family protein [Leptospira ainazelensis]